VIAREVPDFSIPHTVPPDMRGGRSYLPGTKIVVLQGLDQMLVPITAVQPDPANPRNQLKVETLMNGIKRFGMRWPIVANRRTGMIEAGHQRCDALRRLGAQHVPVIWADDDGDTAQAFMVADNAIGERVAEWDEDALSGLLRHWQGIEGGEDLLDALGFGDKELAALLAPGGDDSEEGDDASPRDDLSEQLRVQWGTAIGDVWQIGPHRIICGDSTDPAVLDRLMGDQRARLIFTDPPYNVAYTGAAGSIANDDLGSEFRPFLLAAFQAMLPRCDGAVYVCMSSSELDVLQSAFREAGGHWSTFLVWAKNAFTIGRSDYQRQYEPILYGWREGAPRRYWCGARDQGDVWNFDRPTRSEYHPCLLAESLVFTDHGWVRIDSVQIGDLVLTADGGFHPVSSVSIHAHSGNIYRIRVDVPVPPVDATGNHPFLVVRDGVVAWVRADLIIPGDLIASPLVSIGNDGRMATNKTMRLKTFNLSIPLHTNGFTPIANCEMESGGSDATSVASSNQSIENIGIFDVKDGHRDLDVSYVTSQKLSRFVLRSVESVEKILHNGDVWNLTVTSSPTFQTSIGMSHNTTKPVGLVERAIRNSSEGKDLVLDPFMGSGTTLLAAHRTGRVARGCELSPAYVAVILERAKEEGIGPIQRVEMSDGRA
jgi:DNA modification methylase